MSLRLSVLAASLASLVLGLSVALTARDALAAPIDLTMIGIWSENPGAAQPGSGTDLLKGQKFVIQTTYDPSVTPITSTTVNGFTYYTVDLAGGSAPPTGGGLIPNGNSLDILIPFEGMDGATPFIYASDEFSHGNFPGDPFPSIVPQIHFNDAAGTDFLGFKMESLNLGPGGNVVQLATEITTIDPGGGDPLISTPSTVVNIRDGDAGYGIVIRSINAIVDSVPVQAEAGDALSYSAVDLLRTTDGGTFRNGDGTWRDNDLGAARTDKEDFLTHTWTLQESAEGGVSNTPLVGPDADAERPNIVPSESPFVLQPPPDGTRTVERVNKTVGIADSGLVATTDVATWRIAVNEDLTGFDGGTDIVLVDYDNADLVINSAVATPMGINDLLFELDVEDDDLAINGLGLTDFELLSYALLLDGLPFVGLADLLANGSEFLTGSEAAALFGVGVHALEIRASDRVRTLGGTYVSAVVNFEVIPEPSTGMLLALGLTCMIGASARRES